MSKVIKVVIAVAVFALAVSLLGCKVETGVPEKTPEVKVSTPSPTTVADSPTPGATDDPGLTPTGDPTPPTETDILPTETPTETPEPTPEITESPEVTPTPTQKPTPTPVPTPTEVPTPTPTPSPTPTPTPTPGPTPTPKPEGVDLPEIDI